NPRSPASASPESLRRTRSYARSATRLLVAHLETHEPLDRQPLSALAGELSDRLLVVANPRLLEERVLLVQLLDLAAADLLEHVPGTTGPPRLRIEERALAGDEVRGHVVARDTERHLRHAGGDVLRHRARELLRRLVRPARHLDDHADLVVVMDVRSD